MAVSIESYCWVAEQCVCIIVNKKMNKDKLREVKGQIEGVQALMIAYVTGERADTQPAEYQELYYQLYVALENLEYSNPNQHKSLEAFWSYCKLQELDSYALRRSYVRDIYADILLDIERTLRQAEDPRKWKRANQELTDELSPIRQQGGKAAIRQGRYMLYSCLN